MLYTCELNSYVYTYMYMSVTLSNCALMSSINYVYSAALVKALSVFEMKWLRLAAQTVLFKQFYSSGTK